MSGKSDNAVLIERYFSGLLDQEDNVRFEQKMEQDPDFREQVELFRLSQKIIIQNRLGKVLKKIQQKEVEIKQKKSSKQKIKKWWFLLFSAMLIICFVFYFSSKEEDGDQLVNDETLVEGIEIPVEREIQKPADTLKVLNKKKDQEIVSDKDKNTPIFETREDTSNHQVNMHLKQMVDENNFLELESSEDSGNFEENTIVPEIITPILENPCKGIHINADFNRINPCKGEGSGSITVARVSGGIAPYSYNLNNTQQNNHGSFYNLHAGKYYIEIKDVNGCTTVFDNIVLEEKICRVDLYFSPASGETLQLPVSDKAGIITIMNNEGNIYFQYSLKSDEKYYWDGYSNSGGYETGYLPFYIKYEDGTLIQGSITIAP